MDIDDEEDPATLMALKKEKRKNRMKAKQVELQTEEDERVHL